MNVIIQEMRYPQSQDRPRWLPHNVVRASSHEYLEPSAQPPGPGSTAPRWPDAALLRIYVQSVVSPERRAKDVHATARPRR
eukprot:7145833-Pyramimonas_sp.AAC.1